MTIRIDNDLANPGQFFGCCGLLELADGLQPGAKGWFEGSDFHIASDVTLAELIEKISRVELRAMDPGNSTSTRIQIGSPFNLRLDWWLDDRAGGRDLKVWAGTMESARIAQAMQRTMQAPEFQTPALLNIGCIAYDGEKKVEPYYFDARRGPNAHSRDVGFSPNDLQLTTTAFPAVEFLCLVGLQRAIPTRIKRSRMFEYYTWKQPLPPELVPVAVAGLLPHAHQQGYRFENWYRTGQKKHKAFLPAIPISPRGNP